MVTRMRRDHGSHIRADGSWEHAAGGGDASNTTVNPQSSTDTQRKQSADATRGDANVAHGADVPASSSSSDTEANTDAHRREH